jgi:hypothetical protein
MYFRLLTSAATNLDSPEQLLAKLIMKEQKHTLGSFLVYGAALVFLALLIYVYIGLFSTNPRLQAGSRLLILQWIARFGIPILAAGLLYLCYGIGSARIPLSSVAVLGASLLFCALLAYPLLLYFNPDRALSSVSANLPSRFSGTPK